VFNRAGDEYGLGRVQSLARRHIASRPEELLSACLDEIHNFSASAKQEDDLTLLVLHRSH
jgi:serine phosphatase RsbU (regulator of sigma subunit)